jgi:acyl-CoA thioesterase-1
MEITRRQFSPSYDQPPTYSLRSIPYKSSTDPFNRNLSITRPREQTSSKTVKIVALGDSLTAGLHSQFVLAYPDESTPYTPHLQYLAQEYVKNAGLDVRLNVVNRGVPGDLTPDMLERFERDVVEQKPNYVIIMGGANDIGWNLEVDQIFLNLKSAFDLAESHSIEPVTCAVPSILGFDDLISPRISLNNMIREDAKRRNLAFVDLFTATADTKTKRLLQRYSGDGLHLNTEGYQKLADIIFNEWLQKVLDPHAR